MIPPLLPRPLPRELVARWHALPVWLRAHHTAGTPRASRLRMARTSSPPWLRPASLLADLPRTREPWLARVLPVVRAEVVDVRIAASLGVARTTWATWRAWLSAEHAAGRLPEWSGAWPQPIVGAVPGAPLRGGALARHEAAEARRLATVRDPDALGW